MATRTVQPAVQQPMQLSFLDALKGLPVYVKASAAVKDPVQVARQKFAVNVDTQVKLLQEGGAGRWFEKKSETEIVVCFRNINAVMTIADRQFTTVGSTKDALALFAAAKTAAAAGELDEAFKKTQRKMPEKKAK